MEINLLRHGEYEGEKVYCGVTDRKISQFGWQQMLEVCLKKNSWQSIVSSPLSRCREFAEYLSEMMKLPLHIDPCWQEMNFGEWDGLSALEIMKFDEKKLYSFWENPYENCAPGGETLKNMQSRVLNAWQSLICKNKSVLVITHGGPIRIVHCHVENHPIERLLDIDVQYAELRSHFIPPLNNGFSQ